MHQAHSYLRGSWRREDTSSPMLLATCCLDVDWVCDVVGAPATRVSSFGSLTRPRPEDRPEEAGDRCLSCAVEPGCPLSAKKIDLDHVHEEAARRRPLSVPGVDVTEELITRALVRARADAASTPATTAWSTTRWCTSSVLGALTPRSR